MLRLGSFCTILIALTFLFACSSTPQARLNMARAHLTLTSDPAGAIVWQLWPLEQPPHVLGQTPLKDRTVTFIDNAEFHHMPFAESQKLMTYEGNIVVRVQKRGYISQTLTLKAAPGKKIEHQVTLQPIEKTKTQASEQDGSS